MDESVKQYYKSIIIAEMKQHRPQDAHAVEAIVDHLFNMPQIKTEDDARIFLEKYREAVSKGVGNELP